MCIDLIVVCSFLFAGFMKSETQTSRTVESRIPKNVLSLSLSLYLPIAKCFSIRGQSIVFEVLIEGNNRKPNQYLFVVRNIFTQL